MRGPKPGADRTGMAARRHRPHGSRLRDTPARKQSPRRTCPGACTPPRSSSRSPSGSQWTAARAGTWSSPAATTAAAPPGHLDQGPVVLEPGTRPGNPQPAGRLLHGPVHHVRAAAHRRWGRPPMITLTLAEIATVTGGTLHDAPDPALPVTSTREPQRGLLQAASSRHTT